MIVKRDNYIPVRNENPVSTSGTANQSWSVLLIQDDGDLVKGNVGRCKLSGVYIGSSPVTSRKAVIKKVEVRVSSVVELGVAPYYPKRIV